MWEFRPTNDQLDEPGTLLQELPVIPKFVAEWIEEAKDREQTLYGAIHECPREVDNWFIDGDSSNQEAFARSWLDGFEVEKEPLYRARLKVVTYKGIAAYLRTQSSSAEERLKALEIGSKYIHKDYRHLSEFTEEELKGLNIWDSDQWEIEEAEE